MCNNKIDTVTRLALIDLAESRKQVKIFTIFCLWSQFTSENKSSYISEMYMLYWFHVYKVEVLTIKSQERKDTHSVQISRACHSSCKTPFHSRITLNYNCLSIQVIKTI